MTLFACLRHFGTFFSTIFTSKKRGGYCFGYFRFLVIQKPVNIAIATTNAATSIAISVNLQKKLLAKS